MLHADPVPCSYQYRLARLSPPSSSICFDNTYRMQGVAAIRTSSVPLLPDVTLEDGLAPFTDIANPMFMRISASDTSAASLGYGVEHTGGRGRDCQSVGRYSDAHWTSSAAGSSDTTSLFQGARSGQYSHLFQSASHGEYSPMMMFPTGPGNIPDSYQPLQQQSPSSPRKLGPIAKDRSKDPCKVFVGGVGQGTIESTIRAHFSQYGTIVDCVIVTHRKSGKSRGFGFITYDSENAAMRAVGAKHKIDDVLVECRQALPKDEARVAAPHDSLYMPTKIFVGGIPDIVEEEDFKKFFSKFGEVIDASLAYDKSNHRPRGFGFIVFSSIEAAHTAVGRHSFFGKLVEAKHAVPREPASRGARTTPRRLPTRSPHSDYYQSDDNMMATGNWSPNMFSNLNSHYFPDTDYSQVPSTMCDMSTTATTVVQNHQQMNVFQGNLQFIPQHTMMSPQPMHIMQQQQHQQREGYVSTPTSVGTDYNWPVGIQAQQLHRQQRHSTDVSQSPLIHHRTNSPDTSFLTRLVSPTSTQQRHMSQPAAPGFNSPSGGMIGRISQQKQELKPYLVRSDGTVSGAKVSMFQSSCLADYGASSALAAANIGGMGDVKSSILHGNTVPKELCSPQSWESSNFLVFNNKDYMQQQQQGYRPRTSSIIVDSAPAISSTLHNLVATLLSPQTPPKTAPSATITPLLPDSKLLRQESNLVDVKSTSQDMVSHQISANVGFADVQNSNQQSMVSCNSLSQASFELRSPPQNASPIFTLLRPGMSFTLSPTLCSESTSPKNGTGLLKPESGGYPAPSGRMYVPCYPTGQTVPDTNIQRTNVDDETSGESPTPFFSQFRHSHGALQLPSPTFAPLAGSIPLQQQPIDTAAGSTEILSRLQCFPPSGLQGLGSPVVHPSCSRSIDDLGIIEHCRKHVVGNLKAVTHGYALQRGTDA